jgi:isopropylmalate/homocitrate/citramalate synthase
MIDRSKVWTGTLNEEAMAGGGSLQPIGLYDTTLRDGEQTVGCVLTPEAKLEIAVALDRLGVDRIEAGFARVSEDDARAIEMIMDAGLGTEIWGFCRAVPADVEQLVDLGVSAAVIEAPLSDGKLAAYGLTRDKVKERIVGAVEYATQRGVAVCFFGVDGSRADFAFLDEVYTTAVAAGAAEVAVVDTIGIASPEAAAMMVEACIGWVGSEIPVHWHGHNDFGLATAGSIAAARAGARWIQGTINGMGERAGNTDLGEFALAWEALYGMPTGLRFEELLGVAQLVQRHSGYELAPWKPVTGENTFVRESGAVAMQFHDPEAIEPFSSELVSARRGLVLGKKSGLASITIKAEELGIDVPESEAADVLAEVKALSIRERRLVGDDEFRQIVARVTTAAGAGR